jgi:hypothetical protein
MKIGLYLNTEQFGIDTETVTKYIEENITKEGIKKNIEEYGKYFIDFYDKTLPVSNPKNMAVLVVAPLATIAALSLTVRAAAATLAFTAKTFNILTNVSSELAKTIDERLDKAGDKLADFAFRDTNTEIKTTALLTAAVLGGIGVTILVSPSTPTPPSLWTRWVG